MHSDLFLDRDRLLARGNSKWAKYGPDILPLWVAEMDFAPAPPIRRVLEKMVAQSDYGYPMREQDRGELAVSRAFSRRMLARHGWQTEPGLVLSLADLVQAIYAGIQAFTDPGDEIILQTPAYPPFREAITSTGRKLVAHPIRYTEAGIALDVETLETLVTPRTRMILLCSPHNPSGRVYSREELRRIGEVACEHDLIVLADEVHSDLLYDGRVHIPLASLGPRIASRTVTLNSATKSFNIPGLRCGAMHFGDEDLLARFLARVPRKLLGVPGSPGIDATVAAWDEGQPWLDEVVRHLQDMRDLVAAALAADCPQLTFHKPEATYLGWIDCSALGLNRPAADFFLEHAKLAFSAGQNFDPAADQFIRFNFATSTQLIDEATARMAEVIQRLPGQSRPASVPGNSLHG